MSEFEVRGAGGEMELEGVEVQLWGMGYAGICGAEGTCGSVESGSGEGERRGGGWGKDATRDEVATEYRGAAA